MASVTFSGRLTSWKEEVLSDLRKRWWWVLIASPALAFLWLLIQGRVVGAANKYIDAHISIANITGYASYPVRFLVTAFVFASILIMGLICHAYIETRKPALSGVSGDADILMGRLALGDLLGLQALNQGIFIHLMISTRDIRRTFREFRLEITVDGSQYSARSEREVGNYFHRFDRPYQNHYGMDGVEGAEEAMDDLLAKLRTALEPHTHAEGWVRFEFPNMPIEHDKPEDYKVTLTAIHGSGEKFPIDAERIRKVARNTREYAHVRRQ
jgi:hypothetical protein